MSSSRIREIKDMSNSLIRRRIKTSETVRDAIRQLALKYEMQAGSLEEIRDIIGKAGEKSGETLSLAVRKMREEAI